MSKFLLVCSFYNNPEEHIDLTFNNVLKQTHKNWALIVGDDFSTTPGFKNLLKRKVEEVNDPRIIYYEVKSKRELYLYQNTFQELEYDYYFDLDSDDIIHEKILELYHNNFQKYPKIVSIFSDNIRVSDMGEKQQYSIIRPCNDYIEEFDFRNNNSFEEIYSKRESQQMFGHARCMRKPTETKIHIEKNCKTSTDSLFLFYNLNRGRHLHLPRNLYTYVRREGSDSGHMSPEEHKDFNLNANYYINKLKESKSSYKYSYNPYSQIWLETSTLSTCDFLSQVDAISLISNISSAEYELIKSLYPEKDIQLNNFNHHNLLVTWDKLDNNLKLQLKKVANEVSNLHIFKFNNDFTLKAGKPGESNITDDFSKINTNFVNSLDFLSGFSWWNYFRIVTVNKTSLKPKSFLPKIKSKPQMTDSIHINFAEGPKVTINGNSNKTYNVKFINKTTGQILYSDNINTNMWTACSIKYHVDWKIEIWNEDELIQEHNFDPNNKKVYIHLDSKSLGDTVAWFPYVEEFRKKYNCQVICSTFHNQWFESNYPEIQFVPPGSSVSDIYAGYNIGWFFNESKNPTDPHTIPLQQTASDILGLSYKEIKPLITTPTINPITSEKYVTISIQSTAQCKYWNHPTGWKQVVDFLQEKGYKVAVVDQFKSFGIPGYMNTSPDSDFHLHEKPLDEIMAIIKGAEFHIGIGSGLSWLAWALNTPVVLISSFSQPFCEFKSDCVRIYEDSPFSGYFNSFRMNAQDWNWHPYRDISSMEDWYELEKITPSLVINGIKELL